MKFNISYPVSGAQKSIEIDDEQKLRAFYDKRISQEVNGEVLGDQYKGYLFKITGGNDKQGFPMKQGVLTNTRVRLLMGKDTSCYRPRRSGERRRKSVRGCIVGSDIGVLSLVIVKKGDEELPGLTDKDVPRRLGPKCASKIRKLFNLKKEDDVRKYVIRRELPAKEGKNKKRTKAPKIQRLVTPQRLQRKRHFVAVRRQRYEASKKAAEEYKNLLAKRFSEAKDKRAVRLAAARSASQKLSEKKGETAPVVKPAPAPKAKAAPAKVPAHPPVVAKKPDAVPAKVTGTAKKP